MDIMHRIRDRRGGIMHRIKGEEKGNIMHRTRGGGKRGT